jgi:hypothetical protein
MMATIEMGLQVDLTSSERFNYDVVEWIDKEGNHGFQVFDEGEGKAFAEQLLDKAQRVMMYLAMDDTGGNKGDIAAYVRDNPQLEV